MEKVTVELKQTRVWYQYRFPILLEQPKPRQRDDGARREYHFKRLELNSAANCLQSQINA